MEIKEMMSYVLLDNTIQSYVISLLILSISILVLKVFKFWIISRLRKISKKTKTTVDDILVEAIDKIGWPFYILLSLFIALQFLVLPGIVDKAIHYLTIIVVAYYAVRMIQTIVDGIIQGVIVKNQEKKHNASFIILMGKIAKGVLWAIAVLVIIQNMGYNVSALVAGLGIGGIAIAFALQNILGDIFASFSIYFDKPFEEGDFIVVGTDMGVVKKVGIKTTRIQALQGHEIILSNTELTQTRINNYKKMEKRRVLFTIGVEYGTSIKKMKRIPAIIAEIMQGLEKAQLDRVHFAKFADFSLIYEIVYYVDSSDYNQYMDIQEKINLEIKERFDKEGIAFAYPTQTLYVSKFGSS